MDADEVLLQKLKNGEALTSEQLLQLEKAGLIQPVEAPWTEKARNVPYSDLVREYGFEDEDGEHHNTD